MIVLSLLVAHIPNIPHHAIELRDRGFTVVPNAGLSPTLIGNARAAVDRDFSALQSAATTVGLDSTGQSYLFAEFATRHQFRFDLRPCVEGSNYGAHRGGCPNGGKSSNSRADDEHFGRRDFSRSGDLAGEKASKMVCRFDYGPVPGHIGHRA